MIEFLLEKMTNSIAIYKYTTIGENHNSYGRISINTNTGDVQILEKDATSHFYGMLFQQYYHFTRKITILNVGHFRDR